MTEEPGRVRIHYRRPPDRLDIYSQALVRETPEVIVTLMERTPLERTAYVDGRPHLEPGSPIVWFTFPGLWHDIGRFHLADGTFTGYYANILTPVRLLGPQAWETTDLFLDVWLGLDGRPSILDEDELREAEEKGWVDDATAAAARAEAGRLITLAGHGAWPPPVALEWTLERALGTAGERVV